MENIVPRPERCQRPLQAIVVLDDGKLNIHPVADSDKQAEQIRETLLSWWRRHDA